MNKSTLLPEKCYLGDAVYAEVMEYGDLILTTGDGNNMRIVLDPQVLEALERYLNHIKEAYKARAEEKEEKEKEEKTT